VLATGDTVVDPMALAVAMYIVISLIAYGPDMEDATGQGNRESTIFCYLK
jgi:hypothetical protein